MRKYYRTRRTASVAVLFILLIGLVLPAASCRTGGALAAFLKNIDYYGGTKDEMEQRLGPPDATTHNATGPFVTTFYYPGLEAVFDDYAGRISVLSITDGRWTDGTGVSIGATGDDVAALLGDGYVRLTDGGRDVWVYFCPKASSDEESLLCDYCRVCYISFENGRVSKIEWSTELLEGY
jgi:hypothetical protein